LANEVVSKSIVTKEKFRKIAIHILLLMVQNLNIAEIKQLYPDEWVLIGNPIMDESRLEIISGIPLFHSKDKKEVCYIGRDKTATFDKITLIYTGSFKQQRKITGIFNRIQ
jgi:hypothetical protein